MSANRPPTVHVVLLDGTFASLADGHRTSVGRMFRLLSGQLGTMPAGTRLRLHYGMGQQWNRWRTVPDLAMGRILESALISAYGWLGSGYRPGDRIFLFGYSRGAFAARSLAGMIGRIGLPLPHAATERNVRLAWRYYSAGGDARAMAAFRRRKCHAGVPIRAVGCFDTVAALGVRLPFLAGLSEPRFRFHDARLGPHVEHGLHALALDETRATFAPLLWDDSGGAEKVEQMWFRGAHADIGGQLGGIEFARPLANIPLVWMLDRAGEMGLPLPAEWRHAFPCDATAPPVGSWRRWGKAFLTRRARTAGLTTTEALHASVPRPYPGPAILIGHLAAAQTVSAGSRDDGIVQMSDAVAPTAGWRGGALGGRLWR